MNTFKNTISVLLFALLIQFGNAQNISVDEGYTPQDLVEDILINSTCANVFNVSVSGGNFATGEKSFGYFDGTGTTFPFQNGIILSTGKINNAPGPNGYLSDDGGGMGWNGDPDLNDALGLSNTFNATVLEFDFIPLGNRISFDYIFSSEQYLSSPSSSNQCNYTDGFAFLLKRNGDISYQNLAVVPGTNIPVKVNTVRGSGTICPPANQAYFDAFNGTNHPTNFNGQTKVLKAESDVIPGETYHIKLVIADEGNHRFDSAIFLGGGSFNFGIDLGDDRLIATGNPLCPSETLTVDATQAGATGYQWFRNTNPIPGATNPTYTITSAGDYTVNIFYGTTCSPPSNTLKIEYAESLVINQNSFTKCDADDNQDGKTVFDLDAIKNQLFTNLPADYVISFFELPTSATELPSNFTNTTAYNQTIYARIMNVQGCYSDYPVNLRVNTFGTVLVDETIGLCEDAILTLDAGSGFTSYEWNTNPPQFTQQITVNSGGNYEVTVTNSFNCSKTKTFTVEASGIATIEDIIINDFQENNSATIQISASSLGNYEFSLDDINYQDSNIFTNLLEGEYTVYVNDKKKCGVAKRTFYILDYPKYFTPNGDNYNDTWYIKNLRKRNLQNSTISIFDRYGKLIKQYNANTEAWNGTFNGSNLPSNDYWFTLELTNGKIIKGHFTLKR